MRSGERMLLYVGKPVNDGGKMVLFILGAKVIQPVKWK